MNKSWQMIEEIYKSAQLEFNPNFQRTVLLVRVKGKEACIRMLLHGYRLVNVEGEWFELRCPQCIHFDLSNPPSPYYQLDGDGLLDAWECARRNVLERTRGTAFSVANSEEIEAAISLFGPDITSLRQFECQLACRLLEKASASCAFNDSKNPWEPGRISDAPQHVRQFLADLQRNLRTDILPGMEALIPTFSLKSMGHKNPLWFHIRELGECIVFTGLSCIPHALSYYLTTGSRPYVVEFHIGGDPYRLARRSGDGTLVFRWLTEPPPPAASLVIVDIAYTGQTLSSLRKHLHHPNTTVALFPKSHPALDRADFIVFQDQLIPTNQLREIRQHRQWYVELIKRRGFTPL
jgi:hypothetical protein